MNESHDDSDAMTAPPPAPPPEQATLAHAGAAPSAAAAAGPVAVPGYEILRELGRGGMGVVYQARHLRLNRVVALKMVLAGGHAGAADLARFKTEAEAVARLQHPNIVQIFEVGDCGGLPFFSLEFCGGGNLDNKLNGTPLPPKESAALMEALARAVQAAHERGVVHRDLKPGNVLLADDGTPKITDFGLAKQLGSDAGQTRTGAVMGTPSYMAPEQAGGKSKEVGPATDVYALGAILYECLTGRPPFKAATPLDTMMQVVSDDPVPPRQLQSKTPRDLETICLKCLLKDAARRYATAGALADDLRRFLAGEPIAARPMGRLGRAVKWARRRPAAAALLAVSIGAALLVAALAAGFIVQLKDANDRTRLALEDLRTKTADEAKARDGENAALRRLLLQKQTDVYVKAMAEAQREWRSGNLPRSLTLLASCPADLRGWEWRHLVDCCRRNPTTLHDWCLGCDRTGFGDAALTVAPDGKTLAAGCADEIHLWDLGAGRVVQACKGHHARINRVAMSPDGARLASAAEDQYVMIWDAKTGQKQHEFRRDDYPTGVAFTPDGSQVLSSFGSQLFKISSQTGDPHFLDMGRMLAKRLEPSADGRQVIVYGDEEGRLACQLRDAANGKKTKLLQVDALWVGAPARLAIDAGGTWVVAAGSAGGVNIGSVCVWDASTGREAFHRSFGFDSTVSDAAFSPDGGRLAVCLAASVRLLDVPTGRDGLLLRGRSDRVHCVAFCPDGRLAVGGHEPRNLPNGLGHGGVLELWDPAFPEQTLRMSPEQVAAGKGVAVRDNGSRYILDIDGGKIEFAARYGPVKVSTVNSVDGQTIRDADGKPILRLPGFRLYVAVSPDCRLIAAVENDVPELWDAYALGPKARLAGHTGRVRCLAFSPDGRRLATASEGVDLDASRRRPGEAKVWDGDGRELFTLIGHDGEVLAVAYSPDGARIVTGGADGTVRLWDAATGQEMLSLDGLGGPVTAVAFSADGRRLLAAGRDGGITVWDGPPDAGD
jgi:WD40 repeat protein